MQRESNLDLEEAGSRASWESGWAGELGWVKTSVFWEGGVSVLGIYAMHSSIAAGEGKKM